MSERFQGLKEGSIKRFDVPGRQKQTCLPCPALPPRLASRSSCTAQSTAPKPESILQWCLGKRSDSADAPDLPARSAYETHLMMTFNLDSQYLTAYSNLVHAAINCSWRVTTKTKRKESHLLWNDRGSLGDTPMTSKCFTRAASQYESPLVHWPRKRHRASLSGMPFCDTSPPCRQPAATCRTTKDADVVCICISDAPMLPRRIWLGIYRSVFYSLLDGY